MKSLILTHFFLFSTLGLNITKTVVVTSTINVDKSTLLQLNPQNVYLELLKQDVKHPEIALRQSILETGWYDCKHCSLDENNIFGFYYKGKYIKFDTWQESVAYYKRWQTRHYKGGDYYTFLKKVGYASDPSYIRLLKSLKIQTEK